MNEEEEKVEIEKPSKARGACVCARSLFYRRESALFVFFLFFLLLLTTFLFFPKERKR